MGVDINRVAASAWQAAPLQFVAGLGPRKAQALLRAAGREEGVASRYVLWNELRVLGRCVFRRAVVLSSCASWGFQGFLSLGVWTPR